MLSVKDSGVGISEEEQQLLFKPFSQASCGKKQMGSGLRLTICKELMDRMHGTISVASHPGTGTTMRHICSDSSIRSRPCRFK
ncbi:hypothetical protein LNQ03_22525 [Klebsiella pneumoniae subsp. pneumoniae]|nr:hypothetical protein [Klebsiella pneumoniae subsp. pneumoniae]